LEIFLTVIIIILNFTLLFISFIPTFLILKKKIKIVLCDLHATSVCLSISPIKFWIAKPICMKLGMYITTPKQFSMGYFFFVARQRLGKHASSVTNTHKNKKIFGGVVFYVLLVSSSMGFVPRPLLCNDSVNTFQQ
jgi:hypothetical protein